MEMGTTCLRDRTLVPRLLPALNVGAGAGFVAAGPCCPWPAVSAGDRWIPSSGLLLGFRIMNNAPAAKAHNATVTAVGHHGQGRATWFSCSARRFASTRVSSPVRGKTWL